MLMDARLTELPNGVRVVTSTIPRVESVTMGIWAGVGSRYEPRRLSGISHFLEHMLFKGTRRRSARDISRAIEGRGGYLNAFTQEESTCYYARVAYDQLSRTAEVLADMYLHPALAARELERERGVILEEIMMYRDQPQHVVHEMLGGAVWPDHPLGRPVIGYPEVIASVSHSDMKAYKEAKYIGRNTVFSFAGRVDHEACVDVTAKLLGSMRSGRLPPCRKAAGLKRGSKTAFMKKDIEQAHLAMGFRTFGRQDTRRHTLRLLNAILGENMSSRLFHEVREKHGLAYSVHSIFHLYRDTGVFEISAGLDRARRAKAIALIGRQLKLLKTRPVGVRELKRAKDYVTGQLRLGLESTTHHMIWLGDSLLAFDRIILPEEGIEAAMRVTADDIQELSETVFKGGAGQYGFACKRHRSC